MLVKCPQVTSALLFLNGEDTCCCDFTVMKAKVILQETALVGMRIAL